MNKLEKSHASEERGNHHSSHAHSHQEDDVWASSADSAMNLWVALSNSKTMVIELAGQQQKKKRRCQLQILSTRSLHEGQPL